MNIKANAKINLSLDIIGRDERGYHKLRMVMQSIDLCDDIELKISDKAGIRLTVQDERRCLREADVAGAANAANAAVVAGATNAANAADAVGAVGVADAVGVIGAANAAGAADAANAAGAVDATDAANAAGAVDAAGAANAAGVVGDAGVASAACTVSTACAIPTDRSNLMYKAAEALTMYCGINAGIDMTLIKRIPSEAGLGGGSADAAAVLKGMNELFALGLGEEKLREIGLKLGADIPFCILGGTALAEGIGEQLTTLDNRCNIYVLLIKPKLGMSTPKVYASYDELTGMYGTGIISTQAEHVDTEGLIKALRNGDCTAMFKKIKNVLEEPVIKEIPLIERLKADLMCSGAGAAAMTGSGSVVYGLFTDKERMQLAKEYICGCDYLNEISEIIESKFI